MKITGRTIDETDKRILEMITRGKTYKEIARSLYLKNFTVANRVRAMKKVYECQSTPQLIAHLSELELI